MNELAKKDLREEMAVEVKSFGEAFVNRCREIIAEIEWPQKNRGDDKSFHKELVELKMIVYAHFFHQKGVNLETALWSISDIYCDALHEIGAFGLLNEKGVKRLAEIYVVCPAFWTEAEDGQRPPRPGDVTEPMDIRPLVRLPHPWKTPEGEKHFKYQIGLLMEKGFSEFQANHFLAGAYWNANAQEMENKVADFRAILESMSSVGGDNYETARQALAALESKLTQGTEAESVATEGSEG